MDGVGVRVEVGWSKSEIRVRVWMVGGAAAGGVEMLVGGDASGGGVVGGAATGDGVDGGGAAAEAGPGAGEGD